MAPVTPSDVYAVSPETTTNYEVGMKAEFLQHKLSIDADVYYIRLNNQQLESVVIEDGVPTTAITTAAKSHVEGAELSLTARPVSQWNINTNLAYTRAAFDDYNILSDVNTIVSRSGDAFPNTPKWTAFLASDCTVPFFSSNLNFAASYRYVDSIYVGSGASSNDPIIPVPSWEPHRCQRFTAAWFLAYEALCGKSG